MSRPHGPITKPPPNGTDTQPTDRDVNVSTSAMIGPSRAHLLGALAVAWGAISVMAQHGHEEATCYSSCVLAPASRPAQPPC